MGKQTAALLFVLSVSLQSGVQASNYHVYQKWDAAIAASGEPGRCFGRSEQGYSAPDRPRPYVRTAGLRPGAHRGERACDRY